MLVELGEQGMQPRLGHLVSGMDQVAATDKAEWSMHARKLLEESGIQQLEAQVFGFLYKHSSGIKMLSLLDDAVKLLQV